MQLIALLKKDVLLSRNYLYGILIYTIGFLLFTRFAYPAGLKVPGFTAAVCCTLILISVLMAEGNITMKDERCKKAYALLCASPYRRSFVVLARYLFIGFVMLLVFAVYSLMALLVPDIPSMSGWDVASGLFINTVIYSVVLPLHYKLGYAKAKWVLFSVALMVPVYFNLPESVRSFLNLFMFSTAHSVLIPGMILFMLFAAAVSLFVSIHVFSRKELP